jgi:phenylalanyl-tRNA synthetase beta chain
MLISLNWIKDFVNLPELSPKEIATRFTLATAEVEDVLIQGENLKPILCVEIKSLRPHPDSDKLNLVTFDLGKSELKEVVCGAPNVRVGLKVPYAPIGTTLPNGMTLEPKKIRGILSDGMLCSEVELGLGEGKAGLMELNPEVKAGTPLTDYLKMQPDVILDVDNKSLTHRPDLWGHLGLAREFSAAFKTPLKNPYDQNWQKKIEANFTDVEAPISIKISEETSCLAYLGLSINNVTLGETPDWMKTRLEAVGLRSINLMVDISNYVMVELGIPSHIFDRDKIKGNKVFIHRPTSQFKFKTLDEVERELLPVDTIISDEEKPLVLAGLMGGLESGVTENTTNLFLEVANWEAPEVRKTSVRLGLRTDSSQRYEKSLDSQLCYRTLLRLVELILELSPKARVVGRVQSYFDAKKLNSELVLAITPDEICKTLGKNLDVKMIQSIFESLDFKVSVEGSLLKVTIPSYRTTKDISCKADLIEEIGRIIGYDNIASNSPLLPVRPVRLSKTKSFHRKIQDFLVYQGKALQVMTYPLTGKESLSVAQWPSLNESLVLVNALSVDHDRMRPSLIPSALELVSENQKHFESFSFFEIGRSYLDYSTEKNQLLIGLYSKELSRFVELENMVEKLFSHLNVPFLFTGKSEKFKNSLVPADWKGVHPHEYLNIQIMGKFMGCLNTVHPMILKNYKMKGHFSFALIDLSELEGRELKDKTKYSVLPKFPGSSCDFTVVLDKNIPAGSVISALASLKQKEIKSKTIVDVFFMNETQKAVTFRVNFEDSEKTLNSETIKDLEQSVIQVIEKAGFSLKV